MIVLFKAKQETKTKTKTLVSKLKVTKYTNLAITFYRLITIQFLETDFCVVQDYYKYKNKSTSYIYIIERCSLKDSDMIGDFLL